MSSSQGTLARDLGILQNGGYRVAVEQPVDMFPRTMQIHYYENNIKENPD